MGIANNEKRKERLGSVSNADWDVLFPAIQRLLESGERKEERRHEMKNRRITNPHHLVRPAHNEADHFSYNCPFTIC